MALRFIVKMNKKGVRLFQELGLIHTVRNDLQDILEFVFSTIKIVAGYNYYGQKNYVYQATNSLYHLAHFCCRTLQQNWVYSFKLSKNSKAG